MFLSYNNACTAILEKKQGSNYAFHGPHGFKWLMIMLCYHILCLPQLIVLFRLTLVVMDLKHEVPGSIRQSGFIDIIPYTYLHLT